MSMAINELEMAAADLEVAGVFKEAAENFLEELRTWLAPDGDCPNAPLHREVIKAQTMLIEIDSRLFNAKERLEKAIAQAGLA
ncbi:hypothetical protein ACIPPQ_20055 [Sphingopyxis sp. LARHCG72]